MNEDIAALVQRAGSGDAAAFGELYEQVYKDLYRYALYCLGSREEAEDAVQETALEAFRGMAGLKRPEAFRAWMFSILSARCKRHIRWLVRRREQSDLDGCSLSSPDFSRQSDTALQLQAAIAGLKPEDRQLVLLAVVGGYSGREIAALLGRPEGTLRSRLHRTLKKLRDILPEDIPPYVEPAETGQTAEKSP